MAVHGIMTGIRGIPCEFAGIDKIGESLHIRLPYTSFLECGGNVFLADFRHIHVELVGNETYESLVKFLIESCVKILPEEITRLLESLPGHLGSSPVFGQGHISFHCCQLPGSQPGYEGSGKDQDKQDEEQGRTHEE